MGAFFSTLNMSAEGGEDVELDALSDSDDDDLFQNIQESNDLSEHYLIVVLRELISSGEIHLLSHNQTRNGQLPKITKGPNMDKLKESPLFREILFASGFDNADEAPENKWSLVDMIKGRERGDVKFMRRERCKINNLYLPNQVERQLVRLDSKIFCGSFTKDGDKFVTGSQDQEIRVFDSTTSSYKEINHITAKHVSWTILDTAFSPCSEYFAYSSWADCLHICPLNGTDEDIRCLNLNTNINRFGAFSLAFSNNGKEIISGGSDGRVYIYDRELDRRTLRIPVRNDGQVTDVNCVGFVTDSDFSQLFYSGSDDGCIRVWDRRCLNENDPEASGSLLGHIDGITFIDSKNDGRFLLSNSKDQSIKLWDMRKFSPKETEALIRPMLNTRNWDYRWDSVPKTYYSVTKPVEGDTSIVTFKGHRVQKSLIRAKFSPASSTGQRYIYTGCATGRTIIYDILTGKMVNGGLEGHKDIVRDVSWHPRRNEILSSSWDYTVNINTFQDKSTEKKRSRSQFVPANFDSDLMDVAPPLRRSRRIAQRLAGASTSRQDE